MPEITDLRSALDYLRTQPGQLIETACGGGRPRACARGSAPGE